MPDPSFDWPTLIANKDREIGRLEAVYQANLTAAGCELFHERARLIDPHNVRLEPSGRSISAETILIATGGRPNPHKDLPGHELAITSDEAFHLERLPERIVIAGAGYIAIEFAGIFHGLGVDTTLIYRGPKILGSFDEDLRDAVEEAYLSKGIRILYRQVFEKLERSGERIVATTSAGHTLEVDQVMFALGRLPNTAGLGLEEVGVAVKPNGAIDVDTYSCTNVPNIYAIGDVTARMQLTPVAIREGMAFAQTVFRGNPQSTDYDCVPTAVFSQPELGTVGLTEAVARERFDAIDIYRSRFRPMKHTLSGREERMMMKLIVDRQSDRVLGCHVFGPDAAEMIQLAGVALKMGATKADFDATVALHPTAAEELVTMREPVAS